MFAIRKPDHVQHCYVPGINSCFLKPPQRSWYKQLLSNQLPTLEVQRVAF